MDLYIENDFLKKLEISGKEKTPISYYKLSQLISSCCSEINININENELKIEANKSKSSNGFTIESIKDLTIKKIIKSQKYREIDFNNDFDSKTDLSGYYFTLDNLFESIKHFGVSNTTILNEKGVVSSQINNYSDFYSKCTQSSKIIDNSFRVEEYAPPMNAMLYVDGYLFKHEHKIEKFVKNLRETIDPKLKVPFQLNILTKMEHDGKSLSENQIIKRLKILDEIPNVQYLVSFEKNLGTRDRVFFTNTTYGNIGHPWDDEKNPPTYFTQNYFANNESGEEIHSNYSQFLLDLNRFKKIIDSVPEKMGLSKVKFSNIENIESFKNRIFDVLE